MTELLLDYLLAEGVTVDPDYRFTRLNIFDDERRVFQVQWLCECQFVGTVYGTGVSGNRWLAQEVAARRALEKIMTGE